MVEALIESQPLHAVCKGFMQEIVDAGVSVVRSNLLEVELAEAVFAIALKERWGARWRRHRTDGPLDVACAGYSPRRPSATTPSWPRFRTARVPVGQVAADAVILMADYGLASYEAVHAASAVAVGAEAIITTDTGFALLPSKLLAIYTDRSRVAACRRNRPV